MAVEEMPIPLSEAILRGCRVTAPGKGRYFNYGPMREDGSHDIVAACALGAALVGAVGYEMVSQARLDATEELERRYPILKDGKLPHPGALGEPDYADYVITDLNDDNDGSAWSREDIAYWLADLGL